MPSSKTRPFPDNASVPIYPVAVAPLRVIWALAPAETITDPTCPMEDMPDNDTDAPPDTEMIPADGVDWKAAHLPIA